MEVAGFVIGVLSVAGLLSTCLQLVDQVSSGLDSERAVKILDRKWSAEAFLLKRWGIALGIVDNKLGAPHDKRLDDRELQEEIRAILRTIENLLRDHKQLSQRYGLQLHVQDGSDSTVATERSLRHSLRRKSLWAIKDEKKFMTLVVDFGHLRKLLYELIPPEPNQTTSQTGSETHFKLENVLPLKQTRSAQSSGRSVGQNVATLDLEGPLSECDDTLADLMSGLGLKDDQVKFQRRMMVEAQKNMREMSTIAHKGEMTRAFNWLGALSTHREYDKFRRDRCPKTCDWFLGKPTFLRWVGISPEHPLDGKEFFWLHGNAGSGKTYLATRVVEYMDTHSSSPFAHFFCTFDSPSGHTEAILRSWISQIASQRTRAMLILLKAESLTMGRPPVASDLWSMFREIVNEVADCRFIVDGLDETLKSDPHRADSLEDLRVEFLEDLQRSVANTSARVMILSRNVGFIRHTFTSNSVRFREYMLTLADTFSDLVAYAKVAIGRKLGQEDVQRNERVSKLLAQKSEGMFLWIRLEIPRLESWYSVEEMERVLEEMPTEKAPLHRAYLRNVMQMLDQQELSTKRRAFEALRWTLFAIEPLTIPEMFEAVHLATAPGFVSPGERDTRTLEQFKDAILKACHPFLRCAFHSRSMLGCFRVSHFAVEEYLRTPISNIPIDIISPPLHETTANHRYCASLCAAYLSHPKLGSKELEKVFSSQEALENVPFLRYACTRSIDHARLARGRYKPIFGHIFRQKDSLPNLDMWLRVLLLCRDPRPCFRLQPRKYDKGLEGYQLRKCISPLWIAAYFGFEDIVKHLMLKGFDVYEMADFQLEPMSPSVVPQFLQGDTMFAAAVGHSSIAVTKTILTATSYDFSRHCCVLIEPISVGIFTPKLNAVGLSLCFQYVKMLQYLIYHGAPCDRSGVGDVRMPLTRAVCWRSVPCAELLLRNDAELNAVGSLDGETALIAAAEVRSERCLEFLLSNGADVHVTTTKGETALMKCAFAQSTSDEADAETSSRCINLLLAHGAKVDARNAMGDTALIIASRWLNAMSVRTMLKHGANVHIPGHYGTALRQVAFVNEKVARIKDKIDIIQALISHGADILSIKDAERQAEVEAVMAGMAQVAGGLVFRG
jgi:ankyrin repeat protein